MAQAIQVRNVDKSFAKLKAVDQLNFAVNKGQSYGLLGPNGAGKSTMMKMLYGMAHRDRNNQSSIQVFGYDPADQALEIKYLSGIVQQEDNLDEELTVYHNLITYAVFYRIKGKVADDRISELLAFMELEDKRDAKIRHLSGGMKRRLIIARALINNPKLLILDEPTTGLDPQVRHMIWDKLHSLKGQGVTILLTTHYMEEAYQLCDELAIMHEGRKVLEGNPRRLIQENIEAYVLELYSTEDYQNSLFPASLRVEKTENRFLLYGDNVEHLDKWAKDSDCTNYFLRQSNLEDLFLRTTGRGLYE